VVTGHGKPVAVPLSIEDEEELERLVLVHTLRLQGILEAAREQIRETGGHEEFWWGMEVGSKLWEESSMTYGRLFMGGLPLLAMEDECEC
jgi:hypothetical protein